MNTGQIISGAGHLGLIGWLLFGAALSNDPLPLDVTQVTAISPEEYAAIVSGAKSPEPTSEISPPAVPEVPEDSPALASEADAAPETPTPDPAPEETVPDSAPQPLEAPAEAEVSDEAPTMQPPSEDMAALVPETSSRPQERPAERVAPRQVDPPEPDTEVDDIVREEAVPDEAAETPREDTEATAPEAAATEIVTEAEQAAPSKSVRPKARPTRPAPTPEPEETPEDAPETETAAAEPDPEPEPEPDPAPADATGIEGALAAALGGAEETPAPSAPAPSAPAGPPLTAGEKDGLRVAVQNCWNVGSLGSDALATTVTVAFEMSENAKPVNGTIRMIDSSGGTAGSAKQAYEAARRAIIRCGARGFALPVEKYESWRNVELVFNPENMRIK